MTVKGYCIYEFVELFNKQRWIGNSTAAPKCSVDCTGTVVVHVMKNMSADDIKLLVPDFAASVLKKRDTAFVVMGDETCAGVVRTMSRTRSLDTSRYHMINRNKKL